MIRGDKHAVIGAHRLNNFWQPPIPIFQRAGIAGNIAAVAIMTVKVDKVRKYKVARHRLSHRLDGAFDQRRQATCFQLMTNAAMGENIPDFSNCPNLAIVTDKGVEKIEPRGEGRQSHAGCLCAQIDRRCRL